MTNKLHGGKRVTKLWKDERWQTNMKSAGIASNIAEMNFQLSLDEKETKGTFKRLRNAVKARIAKTIAKYESVEELMDYANKITGYRRILEISELDRNPLNKDDASLIKLLFACGKERATTEEIEKRKPIRIKFITRKGQEDVGVAFLKHKLAGKRHDAQLRFTGVWNGSYVFDVTTLLADLMVENALIEFAKSNVENIRFAYAKDYVNNMTGNVFEAGEIAGKLFHVPHNETFKEDLVAFLKEKHLYPKGVTKVKTLSPRIDKEEKFFRFQEDIEWLVTGTWFSHVVAHEFLSQMFRVRDKTKKEIESATQYETARAFETKKNIPKTHLTKMKNNAFLSRYKFVEIDELLEIEEFEQLEEEFRKLQKLTFIPYSEGSFRVRRLGRHKAAGVYFAHVNATIIDESSSYIHELHHQIDYTSSEEGLLSESIAFRPVLEAYKREVNETIEALPDNNSFKAQWNGTNKYNKNYYLDPAEVFARSAEIYLAEVLKIETSFLKSTYQGKPEYPLSEEFKEAVKEYFDRLYNSFYTKGRKQEKKKQSVAASSPTTSTTPAVTVSIKAEGDQLAFEL